MKIKWTMDETGEDYTEMMCISCGKYMDKDLMVCPFCDHHYHVISKRTYHKQIPTPQQPTPHLTEELFFSPVFRNKRVNLE